MGFLDTLWLAVVLVTFFIGFPLVIYIWIPFAIWSLESFTKFPNTPRFEADKTIIKKARMACIVVFYGVFLAWWFVDYLWRVLMEIYEPGGVF